MADLSKIKLNGVIYNFKDAAARQSIGNITNFEVAIVNILPTSNIDTHTIYFISNEGNNENIYDEYMYIGNSWEKIGSTSTDLSGYLQTTDIANWAKAANKPTYTANEVGALPSSTTYVSSFNGQKGDITYTAPVTSVNGQTGAVTLSIPAATTVTNTLASGTLIATVNGTNIYAPTPVYYYTGTTAPNAQLGNDGDLYFQTNE